MEEKRRHITPVCPYGRWVLIRLMDLNMTQSQLADMLHMKKQNLSAIIHGSLPGIIHRPRIEAILGEPPLKPKNKSMSNTNKALGENTNDLRDII